MIIFLKVLILLTLNTFVTSSEIECEPFPADMKTVKQCCATPRREQSVIDRECSKKIEAKNERQDYESCFMKEYEKFFKSSRESLENGAIQQNLIK